MSNYIAIIKKFNGHFVGLCPELNVSAQGQSLVETREQLKDAIEEYLRFSREKNITSAPLDVDILKEFLVQPDEMDLRIDKDITFSENLSTLIPVYV